MKDCPMIYASLCACDEYHLSAGMPDDSVRCGCGESVDRLDFFPVKPLSHATEEELTALGIGANVMDSADARRRAIRSFWADRESFVLESALGYDVYVFGGETSRLVAHFGDYHSAVSFAESVC